MITPWVSSELTIFSPGMVFPELGVVKPVMAGVGLTGSKAEAVHAYVTTGSVTDEDKGTGVDTAPEQTCWGFEGEAGNITVGFGLITTENVEGVAGEQVAATGITLKTTV